MSWNWWKCPLLYGPCPELPVTYDLKGNVIYIFICTAIYYWCSWHTNILSFSPCEMFSIFASIPKFFTSTLVFWFLASFAFETLCFWLECFRETFVLGSRQCIPIYMGNCSGHRTILSFGGKIYIKVRFINSYIFLWYISQCL